LASCRCPRLGLSMTASATACACRAVVVVRPLIRLLVQREQRLAWLLFMRLLRLGRCFPTLPSFVAGLFTLSSRVLVARLVLQQRRRVVSSGGVCGRRPQPARAIPRDRQRRHTPNPSGRAIDQTLGSIWLGRTPSPNEVTDQTLMNRQPQP